MNVDFLHNQIIRDTVSNQFIESFNENLLPKLYQKYGHSLEHVQFYEDHIKDEMRVGGIFYYPLTVVISGTPKTEWISWQVSNYRIYDKFNPFTYRGSELLDFAFADTLPEGLCEKILGKPIYARENALPIIMKAASEDKTFLAGKYAQSFIDLMAHAVTALIEDELAITGLAESGVILEMNFAPGTYMEHISANSTYRRLRIKARACSARDLWVKWTRLDGNGTYTISDIVDKSMIDFELAENLPGKIKEKEYRYLTAESVEKYQQSMSRKNITEWREMMRRVLSRGEVEKFERITISKTAEPPVQKEEIAVAQPQEPVETEQPIEPTVSAVKIHSARERERDDITQRLNALLGKSDVEFSHEPEAIAETINADLSELLRGALAASTPAERKEEPSAEELIDAIDEQDEQKTDETREHEVESTEQDADSVEEAEEEKEEKAEETATPSIDQTELENRIRRELEEKMRAEMDELRKKNEEAESIKAKLEATKRQEAREKELLAEAARQAVLDAEKREADRRAEAERERIEAERKAERERIEAEARQREAAAKAEAERIEAERKKEAEKRQSIQKPQKPVHLTKKVNLIFRRDIVDKNLAKKVHEIIVATIKHLGKEDVFMHIRANIPDAYTLTLTFSEVPVSEQQLVIDIIQVLGKSGLGIAKATLD